MSSTLKLNNVQVGQSVTATNNFTLYQPATPDGTVRLGVGNAGATTSDAVEFDGTSGIAKVGGYPAFQCRAWVNFNGTGTLAVRASGNTLSVSDNGLGDYTVTFTTAMLDANYAAVFSVAQNYASYNAAYIDSGKVYTTRTASALQIQTVNDSATTASLEDMIEVSLAIFR